MSPESEHKKNSLSITMTAEEVADLPENPHATLSNRHTDPEKHSVVHHSEPSSDNDEIEYPEGGTRAYLTVLGPFIGLIPVFGLVSTTGAIESYIATHQLHDVPTSTVSWIFSIFIVMGNASSIFSGRFFDREGATKPIIVGLVMFCGGLFTAAECTEVWHFVIALGVMYGSGEGILMSPLVGSIAHYFDKKRATATSIATTGGSIGGIVMPLMLRSLYHRVGYSWALRVLGFFALGCLLISLVLTKERFHSRERKITSTKDFAMVYFIDVFDIRSLKEWKFMACALAIAFTECSLILVLVYFPSYAMMRGYFEQTSFLLIITNNATSALGRFIPGVVADICGRFNVVILMITMCAVSSLTLWLPSGENLDVLYVFSALYGFFLGSILSLSPVCCGQISRTEEFGRRFATMYLLGALLILGLIPIGGCIISKGDLTGYNNFIGYTAGLLAIGIGCYCWCRYLCAGFRVCRV